MSAFTPEQQANNAALAAQFEATLGPAPAIPLAVLVRAAAAIEAVYDFELSNSVLPIGVELQVSRSLGELSHYVGKLLASQQAEVTL